MGAACCVAAGERTIQQRNEISRRNVRNSPAWSFRRDNRGRVAGEEGWLSDSTSRNYALHRKSSTRFSAHASDGGSSLETSINGSWNKSPMDETIARSLRTSTSGKSISTESPMEVKELQGSPQCRSLKLSLSAHSMPSVSMSSLSPSQGHLPPSSSNPSGQAYSSPGHELLQGRSGSQSSGRNSPSGSTFPEERYVSHSLPPGSNESTVDSVGRSSDGWSLLAFSELVSNSHREMWSLGHDSYSVPVDKTARPSGRNSRSLSFGLQTCGFCSKLLTEKSAWSSQKINASNELSVVAVLMCGHVYHADCLEYMTPEINKYDPTCPVCTYGEKKVLQLSGRLLKVEKELRARNYKKSKKPAMDTEDLTEYHTWKINGHEVDGGPRMASSSSLKVESEKPLLRRHFSFGIRGAKSTSEAPAVKRKGLFWSKSTKE